ncbi:MAG: efflux RND transporter periplasmic adaptor subunit [Myxococcota bacterium]
MSRVWVPVGIVGGVVALFFATVAWLFVQSRPAVEDVAIVEAAKADLVLKTVATGAIVPRAEVEIKSRVSGVVHALHVVPGQLVESGQLIAEIKVIPDSASLNQANGNVRAAKIEYDNAVVELGRTESLSAQSAVSAVDLQRARTARDLAKQSFDAAWSHLQIIRDGATKGSGDVSTDIRSTVAGMVLAVGVEQGESVTETNTFNAGTTIASVADMSDLIFEGHLDESEVGRIREGMPLDITVGALRDRKIAGTLEYISPKGELIDGSVQFEIRAAIRPEDGLFIRAGSSANGDIVLDRREQVLTIDEAGLNFDGDRVFVEVETGPGRFEPRDVKVGLSDGLKIEVLEGLAEGDRVKATAGPGAGGGRPGGGGRRRG